MDDMRRRYLEQLLEMGDEEIVLPEARRTDAPTNRRPGETDTASPRDASAQGRAPCEQREPSDTTQRVGVGRRAAAQAEPAVAAKPKPALGIVAEAPPAGDLFSVDPVAALPSLDVLAGVVESCRKCPLGSTRLHSVPGEGSARAGLVVVGEAPGATEDETGRPFVGRAGKLLDDILKAIKLAREEVFICNVLKCRPPANRDPEPLEVLACTPYLHRQLELVRPRVILAMGRPAVHALLQSNASLTDLRGKVHRYRGIPVIVTYHPAALLRNPQWKRPTWDDVRLARRIYDGESV